MAFTPMNTADPSPTKPQAHEAAATRTAPLTLWRVAQAVLGVLHMLFGPPETVAAQHTLTAKAHAQIASWLRTAEAMLRRLLLIEASAYPRPNTRPLLRAPRQRTRKLMHFTAEAPGQWRVSFRCFVSSTRRQAQSDQSMTPLACRRRSDLFALSFSTRRRPRRARHTRAANVCVTRQCFARVAHGFTPRRRSASAPLGRWLNDTRRCCASSTHPPPTPNASRAASTPHRTGWKKRSAPHPKHATASMISERSAKRRARVGARTSAQAKRAVHFPY